MSLFKPNTDELLDGQPLDAFTGGYIEAMYFADTGEGDQPSSGAELALETRRRIILACQQFQRVNADLLTRAYDRVGYSEARAGHDFYLTQNGHGAGYWDRDELDADGLGDALTDAAKLYTAVDLYEGDNGLLYLS
jgi:hypothetical protein